MKRLMTILFLIVVINSLAQNNYRVEYFIDNDQGYNLNPYVEVNGSDDFVFDKAISLGKTDEGMHTLFLRIKDNNGDWSTTVSNSFISVDKHSSTVKNMEYYFDNDPGFGNAHNIDIDASTDDVNIVKTITLDNLNDGLHTLHVRVMDDTGNWSTTLSSNFICVDKHNSTVNNIEYYFDNDPGFGNAYNIDIATSSNNVNIIKTITLDNLHDGLHTLYVRAINDTRNWSTTLSRQFICIDLNKWKIKDIEFFIDKDPGLGNGTKIDHAKASKLDLNFNIDLSSYSEGIHSITLRSKNNIDVWSKDYVFNFEIKEGLAITNFENMNLFPYPSPTTGQFTIEFENELNNIEVVITDLSGRVVSENKYKNADRLIGQLNGNNGIYIVYIFSENKIERIFKIEKM